MKKTILLTAAALMVGTMARAQYHEAKLDVVGAGIGSFGALYEYGINDDVGINTHIAYISTDNNNAHNRLTFTADFRYYFDAFEGGDGWFGSAYLKYRSLLASEYWPTYDPMNGNLVLEDYTSGGIALGVTTGRKWVLNDHLVLESYAGIGRYLVNFGGEVPENFDNTGLIIIQEGALDFPTDIRVGFIVGYRF